jgi:hypothetical protein
MFTYSRYNISFPVDFFYRVPALDLQYLEQKHKCLYTYSKMGKPTSTVVTSIHLLLHFLNLCQFESWFSCVDKIVC